MATYSVNQLTTVTVERIMPYGVFVRMEDGSRAYIRRRELTLSGDIVPRQVIKENQISKAKVIELAGPDHMIELSVRATLPDPWEAFDRRARAGDLIRVTVKYLYPDKVVVEIEPGVDGIIPLRELSLQEIERPDDVVWTGDRLEAVLTHLDRTRKRALLSLRLRQEQIQNAKTFLDHLKTQGKPAEMAEERQPEEPALPGMPADEPEKVRLSGLVLVVEDSIEVREPLVHWLKDQGCQVQGFATATDALLHCSPPDCSLVIADLDMPETDGMTLISQLRSAGVNVPIAVMSGPELISAHLVELSTLGVAAAFVKPLDHDEIRQFLLQLTRGEPPSLTSGLPAAAESSSPDGPAEIQPFLQVAGMMRTGRPLSERFQQGLKGLVADTRAEVGIVFHLDPIARIVSLSAREGQVAIHEPAVYALLYSPVKNVILDGEIVWEPRASAEHSYRFRNLLQLLPFESCIGLPLQAGSQCEHALFLFHSLPEAFSRYNLRDALAMAAFMGVALEQQDLAEQMQSMSRILLSGQLAAAFNHEVYNKLSSLDLEFSNLHSDFGKLAADLEVVQRAGQYQAILSELVKARETGVELKRIVKGFRRLAETHNETMIDVNDVLRQAEAQVNPLARRAKVDLRLNLAPDIPAVAGSSFGLYQVCLNLMINAIQQMENRQDAGQLVEVCTSYAGQDKSRPVRILVSDQGPGIHRQRWEKIFDLGFTTRPGGSGLGLYIARSLVEAMGGKIHVEESLMSQGTTLMIELPV